jgi:hypothetical protein
MDGMFPRLWDGHEEEGMTFGELIECPAWQVTTPTIALPPLAVE